MTDSRCFMYRKADLASIFLCFITWNLSEIRSSWGRKKYYSRNAATTVVLRDTPITQWTNTLPPSSNAFWIKWVVLGRYIRRSSYSVSCTGICRWISDVPFSGQYSWHTETTWVIPSLFLVSGLLTAATLAEVSRYKWTASCVDVKKCSLSEIQLIFEYLARARGCSIWHHIVCGTSRPRPGRV